MDHDDPWIRLMFLHKVRGALKKMMKKSELTNIDYYLINGVYSMNLHKVGERTQRAMTKTKNRLENFFTELIDHMDRRSNEDGFAERRLAALK